MSDIGGAPQIAYSQKFYFESLLHREPRDRATLMAYFEILKELSRCCFGLLHASLPDYPSPIFLRGVTSDVLNMDQIFREKEYGFEFAEPPERILDLGAYCGYAAIFLAQRFPNAQIICVEPSVDNFQILKLNTMPYKQIKIVHGAIWPWPTEVHLIDKPEGEWGSIFAERQSGEGEVVRAYTVPEIYRMFGWESADYIKCDIEGSELELFSATDAGEWLRGARYVSLETHDRFKPGCSDAVHRALSPTEFEHEQTRDFHVFRRRNGGPKSPGFHASRRPISLIPSSLYRRPFALVNVPKEPWGFRIIDEQTFQVHPNEPGREASEIVFTLEKADQTRFATRCHLPNQSEYPVVFTVRFMNDDIREICQVQTVAPGHTVELHMALPAKAGPCRIALVTEMAPGANSYGFAWARWIGPCLS